MILEVPFQSGTLWFYDWLCRFFVCLFVCWLLVANGDQVITQGWQWEKRSGVGFTQAPLKVMWPSKTCNSMGNTEEWSVQLKNSLPTYAKCSWAPHPKHQGEGPTEHQKVTQTSMEHTWCCTWNLVFIFQLPGKSHLTPTQCCVWAALPTLEYHDGGVFGTENFRVASIAVG